jgi:RNA polymerase sigma-70 factor, ECF subfamily
VRRVTRSSTRSRSASPAEGRANGRRHDASRQAYTRRDFEDEEQRLQITAAGSAVTFDDNQLIAAVREGDERAFVTLVERYHPSLQRLAHLYIDASTVEDVVQDTWIGVLHGLPNFEGRASFKTWLFRILVNRARTRAVRNARTIPMSSLVHEETETQEYAVDPGRFRPADDQYPGHWLPLLKPSADEMPEERLLAGELELVVRNAIGGLPPAQAEVVRLRDVDGLPSEDVCQLLNLTEGNQRVLLHRGRSRIRAALEAYMAARV